MPFLFFMVFPLAVWDALVCPPASQSGKRAQSRKASRETSSEPSSEPWGRLTP